MAAAPARAARFSLADRLFNPGRVAGLAARLAAADPAFPAPRFTDEAVAPFPGLGLKQRIAHIAATLDRHLPADFDAAAALVLRALPPPLDPGRGDGDFGDFIFAPLGEWAAARADDGTLPRVLDLIGALTQRFSMEFAIRPLIARWPERTLARLHDWAGHPHYHVRRLVSEGTRPRLPWAPRTGLPPAATLPLLDRLHADPARYVTRSVANHLNDIARADPALAVAAVGCWRAAGRQTPAELDWIARHALRTLVARADPGALAALGLDAAPALRVTRLDLAATAVPIGGSLAFSLGLAADRPVRTRLDYTIRFARPGGREATRVYRLATLDLAAGQTATLGKRRRLPADATTLRLYPGRHVLAIRASGVVLATAGFDLLAAAEGAADGAVAGAP